MPACFTGLQGHRDYTSTATQNWKFKEATAQLYTLINNTDNWESSTQSITRSKFTHYSMLLYCTVRTKPTYLYLSSRKCWSKAITVTSVCRDSGFHFLERLANNLISSVLNA